MIVLKSLRRTYRRMFPRYTTGPRRYRDPSADQLAIGGHQKEQSDAGIAAGPNAPVGYVKSYDDGRPRH